MKCSDITLSRVNHTKPEKHQKIYYSSINYKDNPLYIQTPRMKFIEIKEEHNQKYIVVEMNAKDFSIYDFLIKIDDHNLSTTYKSSKDWFNKEVPMDILDNQYKRITTPFNKGDIPKLRLKLPYSRQKYQCNFYDHSNNLIEFDRLTHGMDILCILHIKGLKFLKEHFYCDIYISQVKCFQTFQYSIPKECIIEDDGNMEDDLDIIDQEVINREKNLSLIQVRIKEVTNKINNDKKELLELREKFDNLVNNS